jgi:protein fantom
MKGTSALSPTRTLRDLDNFDTMSEFSVATYESELTVEENVLDFCIDSAEFFGNSLAQVVNTKEISLSANSFITFVSVDFYNHETETSSICEGMNPVYSTQFSFKNRIDSFYVNFLQKKTMKLELMVSKA